MKTSHLIAGLCGLLGLFALIAATGLFIYSGITSEIPYEMAKSFGLAGLTSLGLAAFLSKA